MTLPRRDVARWAALALLGSKAMGCAGGTGSGRFAFQAKVRGTRGEGGSYRFLNERGWVVTLSRATVTLGPLYLNVIPPLRAPTASLLDFFIKPAWAHGEDHLGTGRVVGEVLGQVTFDALSDQVVSFPQRGSITQEEVRTAEVWFLPEPGVAPDAKKLDTVALEVEGKAERDQQTVPFAGRLKLDDSWLGSQMAGSRGNLSVLGIRKTRGIGAAFFPVEGGSLELTFDVKRLFRGADFSGVATSARDGAGITVLRGGATGDQVMTNLYQGLHDVSGTYAVRWLDP